MVHWMAQALTAHKFLSIPINTGILFGISSEIRRLSLVVLQSRHIYVVFLGKAKEELQMKNRPKVEKVSYQMREWSTLLGQELLAWRGVSFRRMFGMTVFYRDGVVFAALPRTLAFDPPS